MSKTLYIWGQQSKQHVMYSDVNCVCCQLFMTCNGYINRFNKDVHIHYLHLYYTLGQQVSKFDILNYQSCLFVSTNHAWYETTLLWSVQIALLNRLT